MTGALIDPAWILAHQTPFTGPPLPTINATSGSMPVQPFNPFSQGLPSYLPPSQQGYAGAGGAPLSQPGFPSPFQFPLPQPPQQFGFPPPSSFAPPPSFSPPSFNGFQPQPSQPLAPITTGQAGDFVQKGRNPVDAFLGVSSPGFAKIPAQDLAAFAAAPPIGNVVAAAREVTRNIDQFVGAAASGVVDAFTSIPSQQLFITAVQSAPQILGAVSQAAPAVTGIVGGIVGASGEVAQLLAGPAAAIPYVGGAVSAVLDVYAPLAKVAGPIVSTVGGVGGAAFAAGTTSPNNQGPIRRIVA